MKDCRLLIIEDDVVISRDLCLRLRKAGFQITDSLSKAEDASDVIESKGVDLVIMDITLDGFLNGIEAASIIHDAYNLPVILITGNTEIDQLKSVNDSDSYAYLTKPIDFTELRFAINLALTKHEMIKTIKKTEQKYRERVKQLKCLYSISKLVDEPSASTGSILEGTAKILPEAFLYPEKTSACIKIDDTIYHSGNYSDDSPISKKEIKLFKTPCGYLTICSSDSSKFLTQEEDEMLTAVAERLGRIIERTRDIEIIEKLSGELIQSQEKERQNIASDLHDGVSQTILAAKINLDEYRKDFPGDDRLERSINLLGNATTELRHIYSNLYPSILSDIGLESAVRWYGSNMLKKNGIDVEYEINISSETDQDEITNIFRITQELFANTLKHSGADTLKYTLRMDAADNSLLLSTCDNGLGFNHQARLQNTLGLTSLRQRSTMLNCTFNIYSTPDSGTTVIMQRKNKQ